MYKAVIKCAVHVTKKKFCLQGGSIPDPPRCEASVLSTELSGTTAKYEDLERLVALVCLSLVPLQDQTALHSTPYQCTRVSAG